MYRGDLPIRNSQFPIWAKGEGDLTCPKPLFLRNTPDIEGDFQPTTPPQDGTTPYIWVAKRDGQPISNTFKKPKAIWARQILHF